MDYLTGQCDRDLVLQTDTIPYVPATLSRYRINYFPPDVYFLHALACFDSVLSHNHDARKVYCNIVAEFRQSPYRAIVEDLGTYVDAHLHHDSCRKDAVDVFPSLLNFGNAYIHHDYSVAMRDRVGDFVEAYFNPKKARSPKVNRTQSRFLCRSIVFRACSDSYGVNPGDYEKWADPATEAAMSTPSGKWPSTEAERNIRSGTVRLMKEAKWALHHNEQIVRWADVWYMARVSPGTIPDALNEMAMGKTPDCVNDDKYLRTNIRPHDVATGRYAGCR